MLKDGHCRAWSSHNTLGSGSEWRIPHQKSSKKVFTGSFCWWENPEHKMFVQKFRPFRHFFKHMRLAFEFVSGSVWTCSEIKPSSIRKSPEPTIFVAKLQRYSTYYPIFSIEEGVIRRDYPLFCAENGVIGKMVDDQALKSLSRVSNIIIFLGHPCTDDPKFTLCQKHVYWRYINFRIGFCLFWVKKKSRGRIGLLTAKL